MMKPKLIILHQIIKKQIVNEESSSDEFGHIVEQIANLGHYNNNKEDLNNQKKYSEYLNSLQLCQYHPMASTSKFIKLVFCFLNRIYHSQFKSIIYS